ncbi:MAG: YajG family lipoprotein [Myxococcaceae bacterium]|nr:YajG family lipoprotein [Myxococcaceae bacterium]
MKTFSFIVAFALFAGCSGSRLNTLRLQWRGINNQTRVNPSVSQALSTTPIVLYELQDSRADPYAIAFDQRNNTVIRTPDNVAQFYGPYLRQMLTAGGARFDGTPLAQLTVELLELTAVEAGMFNGLARFRVTVARGGGQSWTKVYEGHSKRWGRTHNPDNYNDALTNAFIDAARDMLRDNAFANAIAGQGSGPFEAPNSPTTL